VIEYLQDNLALYMFFALCVLIYSGFPLGFVLGGTALLFGMIGWGLDVFELVQFFNLVPRIWSDAAENLVLTSVPLFVFMGLLLEGSGLAEDLLHSVQVLLRKVPAGLALAVNVVGTVLGAPIGIVSASVVMLSLVSLPMMMDRKYSAAFATGTIAASGTLGILIPPSVMLVVMADIMSVSIGPIFYGAFLPGFLLSALYFAYMILVAMLNPAIAPPLDVSESNMSWCQFGKVMWEGFMPSAVLLAATLGVIFAGWATPTESAGCGAFATVLLAWRKGRLSRQSVADVVNRTAVTMGLIFVLYCGSNGFSYVFRSLGGDQLVIAFFQSLDIGPWGILAFLMLVIFLLGLPFEWTEICLIMLPIITPIFMILEFGEHVGRADVITWFLVLMAINLQTAFLTPPFGFALFYVKGTAPVAISMNDIFRGCLPFMILQLTGLVLCIAFPEIILWLPKQMIG